MPNDAITTRTMVGLADAAAICAAPLRLHPYMDAERRQQVAAVRDDFEVTFGKTRHSGSPYEGGGYEGPWTKFYTDIPAADGVGYVCGHIIRFKRTRKYSAHWSAVIQYRHNGLKSTYVTGPYEPNQRCSTTDMKEFIRVELLVHALGVGLIDAPRTTRAA